MESSKLQDVQINDLNIYRDDIELLKSEISKLKEEFQSLKDEKRQRNKEIKTVLVQNLINKICNTYNLQAIDYNDRIIVKKVKTNFEFSPDDFVKIMFGCKDGKRRSDRLISYKDAKNAVGNQQHTRQFWEKVFKIMYVDENENNCEDNFENEEALSEDEDGNIKPI